MAVAFFDWVENAIETFCSANILAMEEDEVINFIGLSLGDETIKRIFKNNTQIIQFIEQKSNDSLTALVPYKVQNILNAPHREKSRWGALPKGSRITIHTVATLPNGEIIKLKSDGQALPKDTNLKFTASFAGVKDRYTIRWQIVNLGEEATSAGQLRGTFEPHKTGKIITEHCGFTGSHSVQCIITRGSNQTLYKSDIFIVNVE